MDPLESDPDDDRDDFDWDRSFTFADNAAATTAALERSRLNFALEFEDGGGGGGFCADFLIMPGEGGRISFCLRGLGAGGFMRSARSLAAFFSD